MIGDVVSNSAGLTLGRALWQQEKKFLLTLPVWTTFKSDVFTT